MGKTLIEKKFENVEQTAKTRFNLVKNYISNCKETDDPEKRKELLRNASDNIQYVSKELSKFDAEYKQFKGDANDKAYGKFIESENYLYMLNSITNFTSKLEQLKYGKNSDLPAREAQEENKQKKPAEVQKNEVSKRINPALVKLNSSKKSNPDFFMPTSTTTMISIINPYVKKQPNNPTDNIETSKQEKIEVVNNNIASSNNAKLAEQETKELKEFETEEKLKQQRADDWNKKTPHEQDQELKEMEKNLPVDDKIATKPTTTHHQVGS